jgi:predicted amidohydrolase YtcJ
MKKALINLPVIVVLILTAACIKQPSSTPTQTSLSELPQPSPTPAPILVIEKSSVMIDFDHTSHGISLGAGGDVDTEIVTVGDPQEQAWRSGNGQVLPAGDGNQVRDWYMAFQVDDEFIYQGSPTTRVRIEIEYLDEGNDQFNIQYDAVSDSSSEEIGVKESELVTKTDSGEFKTAVFILSDAYFGNRTNEADFRLSDYSDGAEIIRRITITLLTSDLAQALTETSDSLFGDQASINFHNGVILTMENGEIVSAIAIKDEFILEVGSDEEVLAYAGPDTVLIDLEGRTLMPGFVDPHSHIFAIWPGDPEGAQSDILSKGITAYAEMSAPEEILQGIVALDAESKLRLRVSLYPAHVDVCGNVLGSWYLNDYPVTREVGAMLQIPGIKIFNDGGACNVPATSYSYLGRTDFGDLYFSVEELSAMLIEIQNNGYQAAIHSLGDRAIGVSQQAIAAALEGGPNTYRHRIEHNAILPDELLTIYSENDINALIFGYFPTCSVIGDTSKYKYVTPPEYQYLEWRWRPLIDANPDAHIAWHADSPPMGPQDPFLHLHGFVTRKQIREDGTVCEPPDWAADDLFTVEEALPMMTIKAAYALHREDELGSLKVGKLADLIILSDNPLEVNPADILDIQVLMTMVGGKVEFCENRQEDICPNFPLP